MRVQGGDAGGHPFGGLPVVGGVDRVGQPGEHVQSVRGEPVGVFAGEVAAAAELEDLQDPYLPIGGAVGAQRQDRVGDGELGCVAGVVAVVFADPERGDRQRGQPPGEIVQEPAEGSLVRARRRAEP